MQSDLDEKAQHTHPVAALVTADVELDVLGIGYPDFNEADRQAVVSAYPRTAQFKEDIIEAFYEGFDHKPETTFGTVNADVLAEKTPLFKEKISAIIRAAEGFALIIRRERKTCRKRCTSWRPIEHPLKPTTDIAAETAREISGAFNALLADVFALYLKIKNFLWHMNGPHFRDYHLLLDEQGDQLFGMIDDIAERVRKIGRTTLRSIGHIARASSALRIADADYVTPKDMLSELREDNKACSA